MSNLNQADGSNPFDVYVTRKEEPSGSSPGARINRARKQAEAQRARTELARTQLEEPDPVEDHHDHTIYEEMVEEFPEAMHAVIEMPTPRRLWLALWFVIWVTLSGIACQANLLGGLILTMPLFFLCMFLARAPQIYQGTLGDGFRNSSSGV